MTAEAIASEQPTITRADLLEFRAAMQHDLQEWEGRLRQDLQGTEGRLRRELQEAEGRLRRELQEAQGGLRRQLQLADARVHREHQHYATKAVLQDLRADIKDMELRLLLRLGGLTVVMTIIMIVVLKL